MRARSKSRLYLFLLALIFSFGSRVHGAGMETAASPILISRPCDAKEKWVVPRKMRETKIGATAELYRRYRNGDLSPAGALAKAHELTKSQGLQSLAAFWIGRLLYDAGLLGMASAQFNQMLAAGPQPSALAFQMAALQCIGRIHGQYPALGLSAEAFRQLPAFFNSLGETSPFLASLQGAVLSQVVTQWGPAEKAPDRAIASELSKSGGPFASYLAALQAAKDGNPAAAISPLHDLLGRRSLPSSLFSQRDEMRLLLARGYYATGQYSLAVHQLESVSPHSNELPFALNDLGWAYLKMNDYPRALGVALRLETTALADVFSPEPYMVAAITLNELCLYPEAMQAINSFRRSYNPSFDWLKHYFETAAPHRPRLYRLALGFLNDDPVSVPEKIAAEWIRSPIFLSHQDLINLTRSEETKIQSWMEASRGTKADGRLLTASTEFFRADGERYLRSLDRVRADNRALIEKELIELTSRMYQQLKDIDDNNQLIEIEVLNGAARDIVWQHDHENSVRKPAAEPVANRLAASSAYLDWGTFDLSSRARKEVWQDEVGTLQAVVQDHCPEMENLQLKGKK